MQAVESAYRLIASEMKAMEDRAQTMFKNVDPFVDEIVRYSFRFGGKRLRPALLFLVGKATASHKDAKNRLSDRHCRTATAIEFVHTASLIHDDILDGAAIRRHLETVNVRWNAQVGVLAGDVLLTKAMQLLLVEDDIYGFRQLSRACEKTCEGELRQIGTIGRFDMSEQEYFEMIAGKTAPLLACSTELGAYYSGANETTVEQFRIFGHKLGLAFQMADDVLDLTGETQSAGKTLRTDLLNRKPTLPVILYLQQCGKEERAEIIRTIQSDSFDSEKAVPILERISNSKVVEATRSLAEQQIEEAIKLISSIQADLEIVDALISIAQFVVHRKN